MLGNVHLDMRELWIPETLNGKGWLQASWVTICPAAETDTELLSNVVGLPVLIAL